MLSWLGRKLSFLWEVLVAVRDATGMRTVPFVLLVLLAIPVILFLALLIIPIGLIGTACSWASDTLARWRGVGQVRDDPVLGPITYEGASTWCVERDLEALGGRFGISVIGSKTGLGPEQHALVHGIVERQQDIRRQVEPWLYRSYQKCAPVWRKEWESLQMPELVEVRLKGLPNLEEAAQIWTLLSPGSVSLNEEPGSFLIRWDCTWDDEHGVEANFVLWQLDESEFGESEVDGCG